MNKTLIKFASIFAAGLMVASSMNTFAATTVQSNVYNAVQTIMRTVFTTNGSASGSVLADINTGSRIYLSGGILSTATGVSVLGLDANGYVTRNISFSGGIQWPQGPQGATWPQWATGATWPQGPQGATGFVVFSGSSTGDADWYEVGTTSSPMNINDNKYTLWKIAIGVTDPIDSVLKVVGNVVFGDVSNRASYAANFSSVLWGLGNHVETHRSSIAGGYNNNIVADADESFIGAGGYNTIHSRASVIGWGEYNTINNGYATAYATIAWGRNNSINGELSTIGWGGYNVITNSFATIAWWVQNGVNGNFGTVGGGTSNVVSARAATIAGWERNSITNLAAVSAILGGTENQIWNANSAIVGGWRNIVNGLSSFLWGGEENIIEAGTMSFLWGGRFNTIKEWDWNTLVWGTKNFVKWFGSSILGWEQNIVSANYSSINGGKDNSIDGNYSTIAGGTLNAISGSNSFIPGWQANVVVWDYSFAGGNWAQALHDHTFVWNATTQTTINSAPLCQDPMVQLSCALWLNDCPPQCIITAPFASTNNSQFIVNADNGVGINTNTPRKALDVSWAIVSSQADVYDFNGSLSGTVDVQGVNSIVIHGTPGSSMSLQWLTNGTPWQIVYVMKSTLDVSFDLTIENSSPFASSIDQIAGSPANSYTLGVGYFGSVTLLYDGNRWVAISFSAYS